MTFSFDSESLAVPYGAGPAFSLEKKCHKCAIVAHYKSSWLTFGKTANLCDCRPQNRVNFVISE